MPGRKSSTWEKSLIVIRPTPILGGWKEVQLSKREVDVLKHIANKGPKIEYRLQCELKISGGTLHGVLERLYEKKLLKPVPKGKARTGKTIKEYHLTALGVAFAVTFPEIRENMLEFSERWKEVIPLVLGKWKFFIDNEVESVAKERLTTAFQETLKGRMIPPHELYSVMTFDPEKAFTHNFYHPELHIGNRKEQEKWMSSVGRDAELKKYIAEFLDFLEYVHTVEGDELRRIKKMFEA